MTAGHFLMVDYIVVGNTSSTDVMIKQQPMANQQHNSGIELIVQLVIPLDVIATNDQKVCGDSRLH